VGPRPLSDVVARPLNFTVRPRQMPSFEVSSRQCPACHSAGVVRNEGPTTLRGATHRCEVCHAQLKAVATSSVLWALPVLALTSGAYYLVLSWISDNASITGFFRAALVGGIGALCFAIPMAVGRRGFAYRQVSQ